MESVSKFINIENNPVIQLADQYASNEYDLSQVRDIQDKRYYIYQGVVCIEEMIERINQEIFKVHKEYENALEELNKIKREDTTEKDYNYTVGRYLRYSNENTCDPINNPINPINNHPRIVEKKKLHDNYLFNLSILEKSVNELRDKWGKIIEDCKEPLATLNTKYSVYNSILSTME